LHTLQVVAEAEVGTTEGREMSRRDQKKLATRRALSAAALRLAFERGPNQVTVDEIADEAEVSARTFFNYFASKEDAMVGIDPTIIEFMRARLIARPVGEPPLLALRNVLVPPEGDIVRIAEWWTRRARLVGAHPSLLPRHLAAVFELERALIEAIVERTGEDDLYAAIAVTAAVNTFRLAVFRWEAAGRDQPLADALDEAFGHLASGLVPPPVRVQRPA
jgi:AcrR family transcriptional regulator